MTLGTKLATRRGSGLACTSGLPSPAHEGFAVDVLACPRCGGRMRVLAAIHPPEATQAILTCLALSARAPPLRAARIDDTSDEALDRAFDVEAEFGA